MSIGGNWKTTLPAFSKRIKKSAELCTQITAKQIIDDAIKIHQLQAVGCVLDGVRKLGLEMHQPQGKKQARQKL